MKALVVYESMFGNTEQIARAVAEGLGESVDLQVVEVADAAAEPGPMSRSSWRAVPPTRSQWPAPRRRNRSGPAWGRQLAALISPSEDHARRDLGPYGPNMRPRIVELGHKRSIDMMYYGPGMGWGMTFMIIGNLLFWGFLIFVAVLVARYVRQGQIGTSQSAEVSAQQIAAQRFAQGEITEEEYRHLLQVLSGGSVEARK
jgi:putative membrane protein